MDFVFVSTPLLTSNYNGRSRFHLTFFFFFFFFGFLNKERILKFAFQITEKPPTETPKQEYSFFFFFLGKKKRKGIGPCPHEHATRWGLLNLKWFWSFWFFCLNFLEFCSRFIYKHCYIYQTKPQVIGSNLPSDSPAQKVTTVKIIIKEKNGFLLQ